MIYDNIDMEIDIVLAIVEKERIERIWASSSLAPRDGKNCSLGRNHIKRV